MRIPAILKLSTNQNLSVAFYNGGTMATVILVLMSDIQFLILEKTVITPLLGRGQQFGRIPCLKNKWLLRCYYIVLIGSFLSPCLSMYFD